MSKLLATVENLLELAEAAREANTRRSERNRRREQLAAKYDLRGLVYGSRCHRAGAEHGLPDRPRPARRC